MNIYLIGKIRVSWLGKKWKIPHLSIDRQTYNWVNYQQYTESYIETNGGFHVNANMLPLIFKEFWNIFK